MSKILAHMQSLPYSNLSLCCIYYTGLDRQTSKKYVNTDCTLRRLVIDLKGFIVIEKVWKCYDIKRVIYVSGKIMMLYRFMAKA